MEIYGNPYEFQGLHFVSRVFLIENGILDGWIAFWEVVIHSGRVYSLHLYMLRSPPDSLHLHMLRSLRKLRSEQKSTT